MKTIKTDADYAEALAEIERLVETEPARTEQAVDRLVAIARLR